MRKISADYIFPVSSELVPQGVIIIADDGTILDVSHREAHDPSSLEIYTGVLTPGFINTHCHLELSHMKGLADTGTGLLPFLQKVVQFRDFPQEEIEAAIKAADREMYENGIVAVGDISNKADTAAQKEKSDIRYYTFVEIFDFLQNGAAEHTFEQYKEVYDLQAADNGNRKSCVPHAPYTVSPKLFELINEVNKSDATVSIHNQETPNEDQFFRDKSGEFLEFYEFFNIPIDEFKPSGKSSIHYAMQHMRPTQRTLFVHNTMTRPEDIQAAHAWNDQVFWATCPNANLYIENRLPNYRYFLGNQARLTIGTDSLTSNWQLSVLEEMKTISRYQSYIPFEKLLRWATLNGAKALGFDEELGSFEEGKRPGILLLNLDEELQLQPDTVVRRVV